MNSHFPNENNLELLESENKLFRSFLKGALLVRWLNLEHLLFLKFYRRQPNKIYSVVAILLVESSYYINRPKTHFGAETRSHSQTMKFHDKRKSTPNSLKLNFYLAFSNKIH